jgi:hypothetical protein
VLIVKIFMKIVVVFVVRFKENGGKPSILLLFY